MFNPNNYVWTEKYRPLKINNIIGESIKSKIVPYMKNIEMMPNFLFESSHPGLGKTTLAKAMINDLKCDRLYLNSSSDRNADTLKKVLNEFAILKSSNNIKKCIFIDEADGLEYNTADIMRNIMEIYHRNVFFILTCNQLNKIPEPIQSRCIIINFSYPDKNEIYEYLKNICEKENLDYTREGVYSIINLYYPSIRNMILCLQDLFVLNKLVIKENIYKHDDIFESMWDKLKSKDYKYIRNAILASDINPMELNRYFWNKFIEEDNTKGIQLCAINERDFSYGADPKIIFVSSLIEFIK